MHVRDDVRQIRGEETNRRVVGRNRRAVLFLVGKEIFSRFLHRASFDEDIERFIRIKRGRIRRRFLTRRARIRHFCFIELFEARELTETRERRRRRKRGGRVRRVRSGERVWAIFYTRTILIKCRDTTRKKPPLFKRDRIDRHRETKDQEK